MIVIVTERVVNLSKRQYAIVIFHDFLRASTLLEQRDNCLDTNTCAAHNGAPALHALYPNNVRMFRQKLWALVSLRCLLQFCFQRVYLLAQFLQFVYHPLCLISCFHFILPERHGERSLRDHATI